MGNRLARIPGQTATWLWTNFQEWVDALWRPKADVFVPGQTFANHGANLARLAAFVFFLTNSALGIQTVAGTRNLAKVISSLPEGLFASTVPYVILIAIAFLTVVQLTFFGWIIRSQQPDLKLEARACAAAYLYVLIPWIPVVTFVASPIFFADRERMMPTFLLVQQGPILVICAVILLVNASRAIALLTKQPWKSALFVNVPAILAVMVMFGKHLF